MVLGKSRMVAINSEWGIESIKSENELIFLSQSGGSNFLKVI